MEIKLETFHYLKCDQHWILFCFRFYLLLQGRFMGRGSVKEKDRQVSSSFGSP